MITISYDACHLLAIQQKTLDAEWTALRTNSWPVDGPNVYLTEQTLTLILLWISSKFQASAAPSELVHCGAFGKTQAAWIMATKDT